MRIILSHKFVLRAMCVPSTSLFSARNIEIKSPEDEQNCFLENAIF